jgi:hypothetical protein
MLPLVGLPTSFFFFIIFAHNILHAVLKAYAFESRIFLQKL